MRASCLMFSIALWILAFAFSFLLPWAPAYCKAGTLQLHIADVELGPTKTVIQPCDITVCLSVPFPAPFVPPSFPPHTIQTLPTAVQSQLKTS